MTFEIPPSLLAVGSLMLVGFGVHIVLLFGKLIAVNQGTQDVLCNISDRIDKQDDRVTRVEADVVGVKERVTVLEVTRCKGLSRDGY